MPAHVRDLTNVTRRRLLRDAAALGALVVGAPLVAACAPAAAPAPAASQPSAAPLPPPETTTIRLAAPSPCDPWFWLSDGFLREEGFTDIRYRAGTPDAGTADFGVSYGNFFVGTVDVGGIPTVAVAGMHTGCLMVFARPEIRTVADLRGKTIAVNSKITKVGDKSVTGLDYGFMTSLFAHIGMQPTDATFVEVGEDKSVVPEFVGGKADAILTASSQGPLLLANPKNPGGVILDTSLDKPWSQNYCCLLVTNRDWAKTNPVALKRATRAFLRGVDAGNRDRRAAAKSAIDQGTYKDPITEQILYDVIKDESFDWRDYDPEETIRFFALRLADAKLIKKTPQQIIAEGADLAWFRQLRKELKA
jgi:NitT/TauT family transport system substrate-binding protein